MPNTITTNRAACNICRDIIQFEALEDCNKQEITVSGKAKKKFIDKGLTKLFNKNRLCSYNIRSGNIAGCKIDEYKIKISPICSNHACMITAEGYLTSLSTKYDSQSS